jgi:histidyl-tRNA synthetase
METIRRIKGTEDILPDESYRWNFLFDTVREVMRLYNYKEVITPIFENTDLFARGIGGDTDIVSKEMYTFNDKGGRSLTLRPEGTASVVRAYIEHSLAGKSPVSRLFYTGPMFRQEKPQKGRKRQFNQFGIEIIGTDSPFADVEGILLNLEILRRLKVGECELMINSIGDPRCRKEYYRDLRSYLRARIDGFCRDCQSRIDKNPLRVFDCKNPDCQERLDGAPVVLDYLDEYNRNHFNEIRSALDALQIGYKVNSRLVRGLDYYTKTVYEIVSPSVGAQDALSGGGRYDLLVEELGGKPTPAFGFAAGIERILLAMDKNAEIEISEKRLDCFIAVPDTFVLTNAVAFAEKLRKAGLSAEIDLLGRSLKAQMREANRLNAKRVIIFGGDEFARGIYSIKDMTTGVQQELSLDTIPDID